MEINEAVSALMSDLEGDPYCNDEDDLDESGKVVIDDIKGGVGSAETLKTNMLGASMEEPAKPSVCKHGWNLFDCGTDTFPYQSHHLVPEKQLPKHVVTVWLTDSPKQKHPKYELKKDTSYDTNAAENGYFMPFASTTHQWYSASGAVTRGKVCYEMMRRVQIQLHQGPHSSRDYLEEPDIETAGYKQQVSEFLTMIFQRGGQHYEECKKCKSKASPRIKVRPLNAIVRQMYTASELLKVLLVAQRIFVSKRAALYFSKNHVGGVIVHPSTPFVSNDHCS